MLTSEAKNHLSAAITLQMMPLLALQDGIVTLWLAGTTHCGYCGLHVNAYAFSQKHPTLHVQTSSASTARLIAVSACMLQAVHGLAA